MTRAQLADVEGEFTEPYLPVGEYGPYPVRLRQQFEGVLWRFRTGGQRRETPAECGAWPTVHNRFRQRRDAGVLEALPEGLITEAAKRNEVDLSLISYDKTPESSLAGLHLHTSVIWIKDLTRTRAGSREPQVIEGRGLPGSQVRALSGSRRPGRRDFGGPPPPGEWGRCATGAAPARGLR